MRAVIVADAVEDSAVVAREVPAVDVVHQPVTVVIDASPTGSFDRVLRRVRGEIGVRVHVAFIDDADVHRAAVLLVVGPGRHRAAAVTRFHSPEGVVGVVRVVRRGVGGVHPVRLRVLHVRARFQRGNRGRHVHRRTQHRDPFTVAEAAHRGRDDLLAHLRIGQAHDLAARRTRGTRSESDDHFTGHKLRAARHRGLGCRGQRGISGGGERCLLGRTGSQRRGGRQRGQTNNERGHLHGHNSGAG